MSWLKAEAPSNISYIVVTPEVSQAPRSWLKAEAYANIERIVVTPEVSHALISSLKDAAAELQSAAHDAVDDDPQNKDVMSVTLPVLHLEIWPYVASANVGFESHASTAILMVLSVMTLLKMSRGVGSGVGCGVGRGVTVGADVGVVDGSGVGSGVGVGVGRGVGLPQTRL